MAHRAGSGSRHIVTFLLSIALAGTPLIVPWFASDAGASVPAPTTSILIPSAGRACRAPRPPWTPPRPMRPPSSSCSSAGTYGLTGDLVGTATATVYGWIEKWNTTTVPNATYALLSEASGPGGSTFSSSVNVTVNNPPATSILIPTAGASVSGTAATLDASASNATTVKFLLFGGTYGLTGELVGTATATLYGWVEKWNTTTVPNATYALLSEASGPGGSTFSSSVNVTVNNPTGSVPPFPTSISASHTYLVDQYGHPFLINGDSAWNLAWGLDSSDQATYLADRRADGFNTVVTDLVGSSANYGKASGANYNGDVPFTGGNFATPNPAYWSKSTLLPAGRQLRDHRIRHPHRRLCHPERQRVQHDDQRPGEGVRTMACQPVPIVPIPGDRVDARQRLRR